VDSVRQVDPRQGGFGKGRIGGPGKAQRRQGEILIIVPNVVESVWEEEEERLYHKGQQSNRIQHD
jgi:hypothetical protein